MPLSRREFLSLAAGAGLAGLAGCGSSTRLLAPAGGFPRASWAFTPGESELIEKAELAVVTRGSAGDDVLRMRARPVPAGLDLGPVEDAMKATMRKAGGVGIAGPQVGLGLRVAVLELDYRTDKPYLVFVRNPVIVERSDETAEGYEGCLSVPGVGGLVRRNRWIRVEHTGPQGEVLTAEAEGANAVLWQHELDHLDGVLYVDKLLGELLPMEEVRRRRKALQKKEQGDGALAPAGLETHTLALAPELRL